MINPVEIIRNKRDGQKLSTKDIENFVSGAVNGGIPEYQVTAFLMATYFQGMDFEETTALTLAMIRSGKQIQFYDEKPKVDKHSTGGVGDKVSLILAPLVASLGVDVPMVAGRALAHTGGTLDKLESIPGFRVHLKVEEFTESVSKLGLSIMGQTEEFVPADKLLYALRDVTATVECIPLITGSILSKKVAEGITGLILDIKIGSGAFMKTQRDAEKLAKSLVAVGSQLGLKVRALLTDMNQPLGLAVGNSLEVLECLDVLKGEGPTDLKEITTELAAHMLVIGNKSSSVSAARAMAKKALQNGAALQKFSEMCRAQGAKGDVCREPGLLPLSSHVLPVPAPRSGYISKFDTEGLGLFAAELGGGRQKMTDSVDYGVGFKLTTKLGEPIQKGKPLALIYFSPERLKTLGLSADDLPVRFNHFVQITNQKVTVPKLVKKVIDWKTK